MNWQILLAATSLLFFCCLGTVAGSNCVDYSVLKFLELNNRTISEPDFLRGLEELGLPVDCRSRSLMDAKKMVEHFGQDVRWIRTTPDKLEQYSVAMVFVPNRSEVGHCFVFHWNGGKCYLYDSDHSGIEENMERLVSPGAPVVALVTSNIYNTVWWKTFWIYMLPCTLFVLLCFCVKKFLTARRIVQSGIPIVLAIALLVGCGDPKAPDNLFQVPLEVDLGDINVETRSVDFNLAVKNLTSEKLTIKAYASCGCLVSGSTAPDFSLAPLEYREIPMTFEVRSSAGPFMEQVAFVAVGKNDSKKVKIQGSVESTPFPEFPSYKIDGCIECPEKINVRLLSCSREPFRVESLAIEGEGHDLVDVGQPAYQANFLDNQAGDLMLDAINIPVEYCGQKVGEETTWELVVAIKGVAEALRIPLHTRTIGPLSMPDSVLMKPADEDGYSNKIRFRLDPRFDASDLRVVAPEGVNAELNIDEKQLSVVGSFSLNKNPVIIPIYLKDKVIHELELVNPPMRR